MITYTGGRNAAGKYCKTALAADLTDIDVMLAAEIKKIHAMRDWPFLYRERTLTSIASTQDYPYPYDTEKPLAVTVTVSSVIYHPKEITSWTDWQRINSQSASVEDNIPQYWFAYNGRVSLYPTSDTTAQTITIHSKILPKDNVVADYTTGTISAVTNGDATVTGGSTVWTTKMAGRYLRVTDSDTAATGDGLWYEIASRTSNTELELTRLYGGVTFTGGSAAYTIGQAIPLPEGHQELPCIGVARKWWAINDDAGRYKMFDEMYKQGLQALVQEWSGSTGSIAIGEDLDDELNGNLFLKLGT